MKQEKLVFGYFIHSGVFYVFLQTKWQVSGYPKISHFGYPVHSLSPNPLSLENYAVD